MHSCKTCFPEVKTADLYMSLLFLLKMELYYFDFNESI